MRDSVNTAENGFLEQKSGYISEIFTFDLLLEILDRQIKPEFLNVFF
jgi:hypothetical protein